MDDLDALLADLESSTAHISKCPVFLPEETPYSFPTGGHLFQDDSPPPPLPPPPSAEALNGSLSPQTDSQHSSQQSLGSAHKVTLSRDSSPPASHSEEDHVYSFPNKQKHSDSSAAAMTSALGSNLSELDRLLLELNAVQQNAPSFSTTEDAAPPLPPCSVAHYIQENGAHPGIILTPASQDKSQKNGTGDGRPTMESLLNELENSVPSPTPNPCALTCDLTDGQLDTPSEQQGRISATSATRELDELMACLSDFKPSSLGSLNSEPLFDQTTTIAEIHLPPTTTVYKSLSPTHPAQPSRCSPSVNFDLHIEEDSGVPGTSPPLSSVVPKPAPSSRWSPSAVSSPRFSPVADVDLDSLIDVSASLITSQVDSIVVLSKTVTTSTSNVPFSLHGGHDPCPVNSSAKLKSYSPITKSPSPVCSPAVSRTPERVSPLVTQTSAGFYISSSERKPSTSSPVPSIPRSAASPFPTVFESQTSSSLWFSKAGSPPLTFHPGSSPAVPKSPSPKPISEQPTVSRKPLPRTAFDSANPEPSLDDALDKLLAMNFNKPEMACPIPDSMTPRLTSEAQPEIYEATIVAADRSEIHPDTNTESDLGDGLLEDQSDCRSDLDWADMELKLVYDGADGSMTPMTEASWMDESLTPSSCPGTPDGQMDLSMVHSPGTMDRISASGHLKSVIRRTKEIPNVHPMYREGMIRRKMGPLIFHKSNSQDRLIEELQGKLGIGRKERVKKQQSDDWLTEGVIVMSNPKRSREDHNREVDKIMAQGKAPHTQVNKLDNMLGSLQSDLHKLGVQTVAKGVCGACCKPIVGQVVTAMGRTWHPEHFVCTHCQEEIGSRNFFEREGQPYCETDYHNLFSPRCYYCNGPILDRVVTALDRTWHPEHFFCAQCGAFFGPEGFHEKDGKAYCRKDYFDLFAPKCGGCARAILENYISALSCLWHPECFVCRECFTPFINGSFFEHDGQPYCEVHYHARRGSLCSGCQKPITGRCISAMGKKFHPEHFVCAFCLKQLNKGTFKEQNDKPYCQGCFIKLFS
ncbi:paxillin isoform X2 [Triplophysa dalaica]|uniref:paxillin isoform X2 n=1 Tax=Triplophysa dalaica TaxID=1582913 RepID=UPI0024DF6628|nr:paxillin isoform X2 [Triplophysa dalaica]